MYRAIEISKIVDGSLIGPDDRFVNTAHIYFDSRRISYGYQAMFLAIKGIHRDGHDFVKKAYDQGVRVFCVYDSVDLPSDATLIKVTNVLKAIQELAAHHRHSFGLKVLGITGSNGKTIVKEWLWSMLKDDYKIIRSPRSFNSQIGVPISVLRITTDHNIGIFEAGISRKEEMDSLAKIISPDVMIFTGLGSAHDSGFTGREEKLKEKLQLAKDAESIICTIEWEEKVRRYYPSKSIFTCPSHLIPASNENHPYVASNIELCAAAMSFLGYDEDVIRDKLKLLYPLSMRLEVLDAINDSVIINDAYSADLESLEIALQLQSRLNNGHQKCLIISDMEDMGLDQKLLLSSISHLLDKYPQDQIFLVGDKISELQYPKAAIYRYASTDDLLHDIPSIHQAVVLIKGARSFGLERVSHKLTRHTHRTQLVIDLEALGHNIDTYTSFLSQDTRVMAVIKADAYGSGSYKIAQSLQQKNVDFLAVAKTSEGIELRTAGIDARIIVLNPEPPSYPHLAAYDLEPEVYSVSQLKEIVNSTGEHLKVHLMVDTGMHRLGIQDHDIEDVLSILSDSSNIRLESIFSHLAASDDENHDEFTQIQIQRYIKMTDLLSEKISYRPLRHILNSVGIIRFPQYQFDMVRLGLGLYGLDTSGDLSGKLEKVHSLTSSIIQLREIENGESVGYDQAFRADKNTIVATLAIGYAE